jgi:hypothetical protein
MISSLVHRDFAARGEQMTIWHADARRDSVSISPKLVEVASSSRSRNTGAKRSGMRPIGVSRPTICFGGRYASSALCSQEAHFSSLWL